MSHSVKLIQPNIWTVSGSCFKDFSQRSYESHNVWLRTNPQSNNFEPKLFSHFQDSVLEKVCMYHG